MSRKEFRMQKTRDMTKGPIEKHILAFALPLMLGNIFEMLYNTVDSIVVGNFVGTQALAAISATTMIVNIAVFFLNGFSVGATVVISNAFGAEDKKRLHTAVETTITTTFVLCALFTFFGIFGTDFLLNLMATPKDVFGEAHTYLVIYFAGVSGLLLYNIGSGILRAVGDAKRPLLFLIFTSILNIFGDLLFVLVFHKGIAGVAYATIISEAISAVMIMYLLIHTDAIYKFKWRDMQIERNTFGRIMSIGLPNGIQSVITAVSNIFVQGYINHFGSICMASWGSYNKIDSFIFLPIQSMAMAATTFVGQNAGARNEKRVNRGTVDSVVTSVTISGIIGVVIWIFAPAAMNLFTNDAKVIAMGTMFTRTNCFFLMFNAVNHVLAAALRGRGDSIGPMAIMLIGFVAIRQIYLFVLTHYISNTAQLVGFGYPVGWMTTCVLEIIYFIVKWKKLGKKE